MTTREQIKNDMTLVAETLQKQRTFGKTPKAAQSKQKPIGCPAKNSDSSPKRNRGKTQLITSLQESLAKRDVRIAELDEAITNLTGQVEHLTTENEQQKKCS